MKMNEKGFTLVEVLAVIVILSVIMSIMIPNVYHLIQKGKNDNYDALKNNIVIAAKNYVSDYRYDIVVDGVCSGPEKSSGGQKNILSIHNTNLSSSKLSIDTLMNKKYLKNETGEVKDPRNGKILNISNSFVTIKYNCRTLDYDYVLNDSDLTWN